MSGVRTPMPITELEQVMPAAYQELRRHTTRLEKHYKDIQDFEFTIENEKLFMLQTRSGKRTGYAAVVIATDLVAEKLLTPNEGAAARRPVVAVAAARRRSSTRRNGRPFRWPPRGCRPRQAPRPGQVVFTADEAVAWVEQGKKVVLVRKETVPDDIHGMYVSQGVLTATGGMTSHAAVVGRQMGKPAIVGASELRVDEEKKILHIDGKQLREGDYIAFDGLSGEVKVEKVATKPSEILQVIDGSMKPAGVGHLSALRQAAAVGRQDPDDGHPRERGPARPGGDRLRVRRAGHRPVPHRAHVLRRGPAADRAADDPGRQRGRPEGAPSTSCCRCSAPTSTACSRRCTAAR